MFLHVTKKKILFCAVSFTSKEVRDSRLQNRACPLFCILQLLYSLYWCSFNLSALPHSGSLPGSAQTESEAIATWEMMFSVILKKKKTRKKKQRKKRKKKRSTSVKLFFSSFILTNDITVQLLLSVVAGGREGGQAG